MKEMMMKWVEGFSFPLRVVSEADLDNYDWIDFQGNFSGYDVFLVVYEIDDMFEGVYNGSKTVEEYVIIS